MPRNRLSLLFSKDSIAPEGGRTPRGFVVNPLADAITPAQAMLYQEAYQQAEKDLQEPEWPLAEYSI